MYIMRYAMYQLLRNASEAVVESCVSERKRVPPSPHNRTTQLFDCGGREELPEELLDSVLFTRERVYLNFEINKHNF